MPPPDRAFDLAVIGAGAAGLSVAHGAARLGARVALIERGRMGGECLHAGCVPSKALLAAAHAARDARRAGRFGVGLGPPAIDWDGVRAHVAGAIARIAPMDSAERYRSLGVAVFRGEARLVSDRALMVDGARLEARRIVIATGSRPSIPPIPGLDALPVLTNETLFELAERPSHLLILGGGAIGLEMAQAHAGLGCRVTLVERGAIGAGQDPVQADTMRAVLAEDGVRLVEHAVVRSASAGDGPGPSVALELADGTRLSGSHLLVAAGRVPVLDGLGAEAIGLSVTASGIATDRGLRSLSHRRIYAAGDIIRSGSGRAGSPMSAAITPASCSDARCSACRPGSTTPPCRR